MNQTEATDLIAEALRGGLHETALGDANNFHSVWTGRGIVKDGPDIVFVVFNDSAALSVTVEVLAP